LISEYPKRFLGCALLVLIFSGFAVGGEEDTSEHIKQGKKYYEAKDFEKAYEEFFKAFQKNPGDKNANFWLAQTAFQKGDYDSALMAYERIMINSADLNSVATARIKLEMARCYFQMKNLDEAEKMFKEVMGTEGIPDAVQKNVQIFLVTISRMRKRHFLNGALTAGWGYSSNVRSDPTQQNDTVKTILGNVRLTPASDSPHDTSYNNTLVLSHRYNFANSPFSWKSVGVLYQQGYTNETNQDAQLLAFQTGPSLTIDNKFIFDFKGLCNYMEQDFKTYLKSFGLSASGMAIINPRLVLTGSVKCENKELCQTRNKDAKNTSFNLGPIFVYGNNRFSSQLGYEGEDTSANTDSYTRWSVNFRYDRKLPKGFGAHLGYKYQETEYEAESALFAQTRVDNVHEYNVGIDKQLSKQVSAALGYTYTKSYSNIGLYRYDNKALAFSLTYSF
jgi:tetratricopeptide (TPR) repeat protein